MECDLSGLTSFNSFDFSNTTAVDIYAGPTETSGDSSPEGVLLDDTTMFFTEVDSNGKITNTVDLNMFESTGEPTVMGDYIVVKDKADKIVKVSSDFAIDQQAQA